MKAKWKRGPAASARQNARFKAKHPESLASSQRKYYAKNAATARARNAAWKAANRTEYNAKRREQRAEQKAAIEAAVQVGLKFL